MALALTNETTLFIDKEIIHALQKTLLCELDIHDNVDFIFCKYARLVVNLNTKIT